MSQEFDFLKDFGFAAVAFYLVYVMLKHSQNKTFEQNDKMLEQSQKILAFAETTIKENTKALERMHEGLMTHIRQKDELIKQNNEFIEEVNECRKKKDRMLRELLDKVEKEKKKY